MAAITYDRVPLHDVRPHPDNPRRGDVDAIAASLQSHGQYRPLVVQLATGFILAGNHTWQAAEGLGWDTIEVGYIDCDDDVARRILLVDNRLGDRATYDNAALAELLQSLTATEDALTGTGWSPEDLVDLMNTMSAPDLSQLRGRFGEADPSAVWPTVKVALPPDQFSRWRRLMDTQAGDNDSEKFVGLLNRISA